MSDQLNIPTSAAVTPATPAAAVAVVAAPVVEPKKIYEQTKPDRAGYYLGTGRRKTSIARVRIKPGTGKFLINGHEPAKYFPEIRDQNDCIAALKTVNVIGKFDVLATVNGGGKTGQAGAVRLGVSRAMLGYDPATHEALREAGLLTRDARKVERKKYGQSGARRRFQFSKR